MWDLLVAILEVFMDSSIDTDALKGHARAEMLPEYQNFKQAQQAQSAAGEAAHTPTPKKRPATVRRISKRTRRTAAPPHA